MVQEISISIPQELHIHTAAISAPHAAIPQQTQESHSKITAIPKPSYSNTIMIIN
jgi:hypothetical protein